MFSVADAVARITLNRPRTLNAFTTGMSLELAAALRRAGAPDVRCVVLTGAGGAFSSGTDLKANYAGDAPQAADETLRRLRNPLILAVRALEKPVVAAVNGVAAGIGLSLALACDLLVAAESASLVPAFARVGLMPDGGATWTLTHRLGRARALELAFLGEPLSAAQAVALGLATRAIPDADFEAEVDALARKLARGPTRAFGEAKRAIDRACAASFADQLEWEAQAQGRVAATEDFREGVQAFLARRRPEFVGR